MFNCFPNLYNNDRCKLSEYQVISNEKTLYNETTLTELKNQILNERRRDLEEYTGQIQKKIENLLNEKSNTKNKYYILGSFCYGLSDDILKNIDKMLRLRKVYYKVKIKNDVPWWKYLICQDGAYPNRQIMIKILDQIKYPQKLYNKIVQKQSKEIPSTYQQYSNEDFIKNLSFCIDIKKKGYYTLHNYKLVLGSYNYKYSSDKEYIFISLNTKY